MAIIAPLVSFFLELLGTLGEGEGGGNTGEQGFNGRPHKKEFPTNEELGNFWSEDGIEPLR